ncbi:hypothetical protein [Mahella australiensis]|uniref:hypothetical protein n=1 Tax=Mahella australiensis TaxID=252966 RepID=UPI001494E79A|nr:hypothetical protein [Mahella australiensis]
MVVLVVKKLYKFTTPDHDEERLFMLLKYQPVDDIPEFPVSYIVTLALTPPFPSASIVITPAANARNGKIIVAQHTIKVTVINRVIPFSHPSIKLAACLNPAIC